MLLVAEILFAIWFYRADNSVERSIAGLIMAIFFVCLMLLIMKMNKIPYKEKFKHRSFWANEILWKKQSANTSIFIYDPPPKEISYRIKKLD